jgi:hypothetical protein
VTFSEFQANHILAFDDDGVMIHAMHKEAAARVTATLRGGTGEARDRPHVVRHSGLRKAVIVCSRRLDKGILQAKTPLYGYRLTDSEVLPKK